LSNLQVQLEKTAAEVSSLHMRLHDREGELADLQVLHKASVTDAAKRCGETESEIAEVRNGQASPAFINGLRCGTRIEKSWPSSRPSSPNKVQKARAKLTGSTSDMPRRSKRFNTSTLLDFGADFCLTASWGVRKSKHQLFMASQIAHCEQVHLEYLEKGMQLQESKVEFDNLQALSRLNIDRILKEHEVELDSVSLPYLLYYMVAYITLLQYKIRLSDKTLKRRPNGCNRRMRCFKTNLKQRKSGFLTKLWR